MMATPILTPAPTLPLFAPMPAPTLSVKVEVIPPSTSTRIDDILTLVVGDPLTVTVTVENNNSVGCSDYEVSLDVNTGSLSLTSPPIIYQSTSPPKVKQRGHSVTTFTLTMIEDSAWQHQVDAVISGEPDCAGFGFGTWFRVYPDQATAALASSTQCRYVPEAGFRLIWATESELRLALGCPAAFGPRNVPQAWEVETGYQSFEHGEMIWTNRQVGWYGPPFVHVFYADGTYQSFPDKFDPNIDPIRGNEMPPSGRVEPGYGFGKIWREQPEVRQKLGWAIAEEIAGTGVSQAFITGHMLWLSQTNQTYVFTTGAVRVFDIPYSN